MPFSSAGLFGKLPAYGDFVRVRAAEPAARAFAAWLSEGYEAARQGGVHRGPEPVRFLYRPSALEGVLLGVLADSADKVGRRFPLAVFTQARASELAIAYPALPAAARAFLDAATTLVQGAGELLPADLPARLDALPVPAVASLPGEVQKARDLASRGRGHEVLARLFGDLARRQHHYAWHCFKSACAPVRQREPSSASVVLDCPGREDQDRFAWLELARRELSWAAPPSFAWREGERPRLALSLGPFPVALYGLLCDDGRRDGKLWPLTTAQPAALAAADRALGAAVVALLDRTDLSLLDLIAALSP
ncbi:MAG TPA: type VI secretion system-associated protein TagF [Anaeromyxobacteraceae bacterium]|nr:type VI secretion system-associated protein TagF [Anaeromyxobacteraceae bacterium]